jgi:hypothetical protein
VRPFPSLLRTTSSAGLQPVDPAVARLAPAGLDRCRRRQGHSLRCMRAVQITRFGGPEVMDVVDLPDPTPGEGEQLFDISSSGVNFADTHHRLS